MGKIIRGLTAYDESFPIPGFTRPACACGNHAHDAAPFDPTARPSADAIRADGLRHYGLGTAIDAGRATATKVAAAAFWAARNAPYVARDPINRRNRAFWAGHGSK